MAFTHDREHEKADSWSRDSAASYLPNNRPLPEPPTFDYAAYVEQNRDATPSDTRLKPLFAEDIGLGFQWRDGMTEDLTFLFVLVLDL